MEALQLLQGNFVVHSNANAASQLLHMTRSDRVTLFIPTIIRHDSLTPCYHIFVFNSFLTLS